MIDKHNIQAILQGCKEQDASAQRALLEWQGDRLYALCIRYIGNREKAKDALQECFIRVFKYIDKYDKRKGEFDKWVNTICIRQCLKQLDKKTLKIIELNPKNSNQFSQSPKIIEQMNADEILQLVEKLPEGYRQIFNLHVIEGYSHKEISTLLGMKEVSSRSKLSQSKRNASM